MGELAAAADRKNLSAWLIGGLVTLLACIVCVRLSILLDSKILLCAAYSVPSALVIRNAYRGVASLMAVVACGLVVLREAGTANQVSFVLVGIVFTFVVLYGSALVTLKLTEARKGLRLVTARSSAYRNALDVASVPVVILDDARGFWLAANEAALSAVGVSRAFKAMEELRTELDNGAVEALMHSASRAQWLAWIERYFAARQRVGASKPYEAPIILFDEFSQPTKYLLRAFAGEAGDTVLVACRTD